MITKDIPDPWPPGGEDPLVDALAEVCLGSGRDRDIPGLLNDPRLGRVANVSPFGADSAVLLHFVARIRKDWAVLFLDTGKHFPETPAYADELREALGLSVMFIRPDLAQIAEDDLHGTLWMHSPNYCCTIRKQFPLQDALAGFDTWITGRKRFQSVTRHALPVIERDGAHLKINPLACWTADDILGYLKDHDPPRHPLVARGFPSIGCAPCTQQVTEGADLRAGRWAHVPDKTECGIHLGPDGTFRRPKA